MNEKDKNLAQGIVREWAEHDMNEHYDSDYLRDEFGSERLEDRIVDALTTVRQEARAAAFGEMVGVVAVLPTRGTMNYRRGYEEGVRDALRTIEAAANSVPKDENDETAKSIEQIGY